MHEILILHAPLAGAGEDVRADSLSSRLPYARRLELARRDSASRLASLAGVALALAGATRLRGGLVEPGQLRFPAGGKPSLADGPSFSIAHSATRVAAAISDDCEVGLDLEDATAALVDAKSMARLRRWTAIEAALKAVGAPLRSVGRLHMDDDLSTASFAGRDLNLHSIAIAPDCVARLATQVRFVDVRVEWVPVPWSCLAPPAM